MMRTKLIAAIVAVGALALVGCSSNGAAGTAAPANTPAAGAPASADTGGGAASSPGAGAPQSSQPADTGSADTNSEQPTVTLSGGLDPQTGVWFSAFCSTLGPAYGSLATEAGAMATATGADQQAAAVKVYGSLADALTNTADALKPLPPPTFSGGQQFASDVVTALGSAGTSLKSSVQKLQAVDPTDEAALQQAIEAAGDGMETSLDSMSQYELSDDTQKAFQALPACAPFADAGDDSAASTTG